MRNRIKNILDTKKGFAMTLLMMFILFFMLNLCINANNFNRVSNVYDTELQNGVGEAVRNASYMVKKESMATGKPILDENLCHEAFLKIINSRLQGGKLNNYSLLVYNHGYGEEGEIHLYIFRDGSLTHNNVTLLNDNGQTFYITNSGDISLDYGEICNDMKITGCMAIAEIETEYILSDVKTGATRWASAEVVLADDFY